MFSQACKRNGDIDNSIKYHDLHNEYEKKSMYAEKAASLNKLAKKEYFENHLKGNSIGNINRLATLYSERNGTRIAAM